MGCGQSSGNAESILEPQQQSAFSSGNSNNRNISGSGRNEDFPDWQPPTLSTKDVAHLTSKQHSHLDVSNFQTEKTDLPLPKPPTSSKKDLLQKDSHNASLYDPRKISPTDKQSLEEFTRDVLLPPESAELQRNVEITATAKENFAEEVNVTGGDSKSILEGSTAENLLDPIQNDSVPVTTKTSLQAPMPDDETAALKTSQTPEAPSRERGALPAMFDIPKATFEDKVRQQLKELREREKIAKDMRETDKIKQQQTLKEKLKKRSELKRKQRKEAAAAAASINVAQDELEAPSQAALRDIILEPEVTAVPEPAIPVTSKELLYKEEENIELFRDLENYAVSMEKVTSESVTFANLMDNLLIVQLSDLEKVRIIFHWITAQDLNAINFPSMVEEDTPLGFLLAIKEDRKTYASLFVRLCGAASLHAKQITGYLKGVGYYPDYKFGGKEDPFRGSWNAVLIDGQWRLIDTNWGARHVTEEDEKTCDSWKTEYKYEEHYFLSDPDQFINTHFPDETDWQLLKNPFTLQEFETNVKLWPLFYKLKLALRSHKCGVVEADGSGHVTIELKASAFARTDAKFQAELKPRRKDSGRHLTELLKRCMFHFTQADVETFDVFLPSSGEYLLKIFALSNKYSDENVFTNICFYQINCGELQVQPQTSLQPPFPAVSMFYGMSALNSQLIARPVSHPGAVVQCDQNGEATVVMCVVAEDKNISFTHDLFDSSIPTRPLPDRVLHSFDDSSGRTNITYTIRTPKPGNYALALYSNQEDTSSTTYVPFCYYLVTSREQNQTTVDFPKIPNKLVGRIQPSFDDLSLDVISCHPKVKNYWKSGVLWTDSNAECSLVFSHSKPLTIIAELTSANQTDYSNYASVETTGQITAIMLRAPERGPCCLKIYAAELSQASNLPSVYVAVMFSNPPKNPVSPLPQCPIRTWGPAGLTSVKYGLTGLNFQNSTSVLKNKCDNPDLNKSGPTRIYDGGEDFGMELQLSTPLHLKAKVQNLDGNAENFETFVFLEKANLESATVRMRLVKNGTFSLVVYGCTPDDNSGQLSPLAYCLVYVNAPSACVMPFPIAFGIWGSSARQLFCPLYQNLERDEELTFKLYLAKYEKRETGWSTVRFPDVMAVIDGSNPVEALSQSGCEYEWKYIARPGEKVFGILIKSDENSDAMTYALQYAIL